MSWSSQPARIRHAVVIACSLGLTGCIPSFDCSNNYLFQVWAGGSFDAADGGGTTVLTSPDGGTEVLLNLSGAHFGSNQTFYIGQCSFDVDIETDNSGDYGTFSLSNPNPDNSGCISKESTEIWNLGCNSLSVTTPYGTTNYSLAQ